MACKQDLAASLRAYCNGDVQALAAVPIALMGTSLQRHVWTLVRGIAAGNVAKCCARPAARNGSYGNRQRKRVAGDDSVQLIAC